MGWACAMLWGQPEHHRFVHLDMEAGLSHSTVTTLFQDRQGFLWIGTWDGLNVYDGYTFHVYRHDGHEPSSISDNNIYGIAQADPDTLWVGTAGGGLNQLDLTTQKFLRYHHNPQNPNSLSHDNVRALLCDSRGRLWAATSGGGVNLFDPSLNGFRHFHAEQGSPVSNDTRAMVEANDGSIWVGTSQGLALIDPHSPTYRLWPENTDSPALRSFIGALVLDGNGILWVGSAMGLVRLDTKTHGFQIFPHDPEDTNSISDDSVRALTRDTQGRIWVGTGSGGLCCFDPDQGRFERYPHRPCDPDSLGSMDVRALLQDQCGMLWVGTNGAWLQKLNLQSRPFRHFKNEPGIPGSLSHNQVRAIHTDSQGTHWVGTDGGGLNRLKAEDGRFDHYRHDPSSAHSLSSDHVYDLAEDDHGILWVATDGGLDYLRRGQSIFQHRRYNAQDPGSLSSNHTRSLLADSQGRLWVGTKGAGLNLQPASATRFIRFLHDPDDPRSLSENQVYQIMEDRHQRVWIGTFGGLNLFDERSKGFIRYSHREDDPHSLSHDRVFAICEAKDGRIWVGTGYGLCRYDAEAHGFDVFFPGEHHANRSNRVYGVVGDESGMIWLSTSGGLARLDPFRREFRFFKVYHGLQSPSYNLTAFHEDRDGQIFFGGINGYNAFYPEHVAPDPCPPPVHLSVTLSNGKSEWQGDPQRLKRDRAEPTAIKVPHRVRKISFSFSALHFLAPEDNRYACKLDGWEDQWTELGADRRYVSYSRLEPGAYTFRVKASNPDGTWNEDPAKIRLRVMPPPWMSWWAFLIYAAALGWLGFGLWVLLDRRAKIRQVRLTEQNILLEQRVQDRTRQLEEMHRELVEKAHHAGMADIATSVLHNVGNVLNSLTISGESLKQNVPVGLTRSMSKAVAFLESLMPQMTQVSEPKRAQLLRYFHLIQATLEDMVQNLSEEVLRVQEKTELIREIIAAQQVYASVDPSTHVLPVEQTIRDTLMIMEAPLNRASVDVALHCQPDITARFNRSKLVHVLINLQKNAVEAMAETPPAQRKLTIDVVPQQTCVQIRIHDQGKGIAADNLDRIFSMDFARRRRELGFTLHDCSTAMMEMQGRVWAESQGPGHGATFIVELNRR